MRLATWRDDNGKRCVLTVFTELMPQASLELRLDPRLGAIENDGAISPEWQPPRFDAGPPCVAVGADEEQCLAGSKCPAEAPEESSFAQLNITCPCSPRAQTGGRQSSRVSRGRCDTPWHRGRPERRESTLRRRKYAWVSEAWHEETSAGPQEAAAEARCASMSWRAARTRALLSGAKVPSGSRVMSSRPVRIPWPRSSARRLTAQQALP
jgi:hypothetical protein